MSWYWSLLTILNIGINIMPAAMPFQVAPFIGQVSDEVPPASRYFHIYID